MYHSGRCRHFRPRPAPARRQPPHACHCACSANRAPARRTPRPHTPQHCPITAGSGTEPSPAGQRPGRARAAAYPTPAGRCAQPHMLVRALCVRVPPPSRLPAGPPAPPAPASARATSTPAWPRGSSALLRMPVPRALRTLCHAPGRHCTCRPAQPVTMTTPDPHTPVCAYWVPGPAQTVGCNVTPSSCDMFPSFPRIRRGAWLCARRHPQHARQPRHPDPTARSRSRTPLQGAAAAPLATPPTR